MVVIDLVSASKLKTDFKKYEKDELENLSAAECDAYVESLVIELMKGFKNGTIFENPDADEINDLIDSYLEVAETKFSNAAYVLLLRKFKYLVNAYVTANAISVNRVFDLKTALLSELEGNSKGVPRQHLASRDARGQHSRGRLYGAVPASPALDPTLLQADFTKIIYMIH